MNRSIYCLDLKPIAFMLLLVGSIAAQSCGQQADVTLSVDANHVAGKITPWLYGSCIEDVNHEIYGGIYDQKIFGESFEEPVPSAEIDGFRAYEGHWSAELNELAVNAFPGAKLVYDSLIVSKAIVSTDIKFGKNDGEGKNAGLLIHVADPGNGADYFHGYEISLSAHGEKVVLAKHMNNFEHIEDIPVAVNPNRWNTLKVAIHGKQIEVYLNGNRVARLAEKDGDLQSGKIAVRTWNAEARFRNFEIIADGAAKNIAFHAVPPINISAQWDALASGDVASAFDLATDGAFNGKNAQIVQFLSGEGMVGITNSSLNRWGIAIAQGQRMQGRLYLKAQHLQGPVTVALQSADGQKEYARQQITGVSSQWQAFPFELDANGADKNARFAVYLDKPGQLWVDQVTLMNTGDKQFKGLPVRADIARAMVNQGLTFLRYGGTMINAPEYRFKKMIGNPDKRPPYTGHWYRYATNGFGIEEFLQLCEAAGFTASFAINIEEQPQDAADMIEYLNGPITSEWGRRRAENGHPEPYHVKYIGIGNEEVLFNGDVAEEYDHYIERFNLLYDAIKSKDSSVSLINTAWWRPESPNVEKVFRALDGKADYWDYHPWADKLTAGAEVEAELRKMKARFQQWNPNTTMKCAIFEENGNTHNVERALGHVTLQNAVRRMGDFVLTSCAANALQPYKQNDNGWDQGQLFFTPSEVWGMPPYYAQQMASQYHMPLLVHSALEGVTDKLDVTATRSEGGNQLVLHVANIGEKALAVNLKIDGFAEINSAKSIMLNGGLTTVNSLEEPTRVVPQEKPIKHSPNQLITLLPYSYTVIVFSK